MKKILATILAGLMLASASAVSFSAAENDINESGGNGTTKVTVDFNGSIFKVTVPTILPIEVDSENNVTVAHNAVITNLGDAPVKVAAARLNGSNSWSIVDFDTDFKTIPVDSKKYGMVINNAEVATDGTIALTGFTAIGGGETHAVTYDANVAIQSMPLNGAEIGKVIFTVTWDN